MNKIQELVTTLTLSHSVRFSFSSLYHFLHGITPWATTNTGTFPSSPPFSSSTASPLQAVSSLLMLPLPSMNLTEKNYLVSCHFMLATLTSNCATRFLLGTEISHRFLNDDDRLINRVNLAYLRWEELDQYLWEELDSFCNSQTKARSRQLRSQLRSISQGSSTILKFFMKIKGLVDALIFIVASVSHMSPKPVDSHLRPNQHQLMSPASFFSSRSESLAPTYYGGCGGSSGYHGSCGGHSSLTFCDFCNCRGHDISMCYYAPSSFGGIYPTPLTHSGGFGGAGGFRGYRGSHRGGRNRGGRFSGRSSSASIAIVMVMTLPHAIMLLLILEYLIFLLHMLHLPCHVNSKIIFLNSMGLNNNIQPTFFQIIKGTFIPVTILMLIMDFRPIHLLNFLKTLYLDQVHPIQDIILNHMP
ncbi:hypothetical protein Lal_00026079 [Lupinus albus]|nr:hypothetical protein Lal_00026079 [Lupinus albus]